MFPHPHDALPLPPRPNLEQYKSRAKELLKAARSRSAHAIRDWTEDWLSALVALGATFDGDGTRTRFEDEVDHVAAFLRLNLAGTSEKQTSLVDAQFAIALLHGFASWPRLAKHLRGLSQSEDRFEQAVDGIVTGDLDLLKHLLQTHPDLVRLRSERQHHATLLHYVSANGVENFRQRTPKNIVEIARVLLDYGADVDAVADLYGGSTPLELVATSLPPEQAGVQEALLELFLVHGAKTERGEVSTGKRSLVASCLANGRRKAAEYLAARGAPLDFEAAAGVGRLDMVRSLLRLQPGPAKQQIEQGFLWACGFGRRPIVELLLAHGVDVSAQDRSGQTALHRAVIGRQQEIVKLLIEKGASLQQRNEYGGNPLGQAIWCVLHGGADEEYFAIIDLLVHQDTADRENHLAWLKEEANSGNSPNPHLLAKLISHLSGTANNGSS